MSAPPLQAAQLLSALAAHRVDFVIIGGFALSAHGVVRGTKDIDIVPDPRSENIRRLACALRALDAEVMLAENFDPAELGLGPDEDGPCVTRRSNARSPTPDASGSPGSTT